MTQELAELKARQKELEKSGMGLGFEEYACLMYSAFDISFVVPLNSRCFCTSASRTFL